MSETFNIYYKEKSSKVNIFWQYRFVKINWLTRDSDALKLLNEFYREIYEKWRKYCETSRWKDK